MLVLRLVAQRRETAKPKNISDISRTVGSGDLAPDHSDLGAADLLLRLVDVRDLLAKVEAVCVRRVSSSIHLGDTFEQ